MTDEMTTGAMLAQQIEDTRQWTLKLLADVRGSDWTFQAAPGLPHATWLCGHLAVSQHVLVHMRCLGRGVLEDEFIRAFPIGGPVPPAEPGAFPSVDEILARMAEVHARTWAVVRGMSDELLNEPAFAADGKPHPHYSDKRGAVSHCARHEAFHAGQLAWIRRLTGKPFLR